MRPSENWSALLCWVGAVVDSVMVIALLEPRLGGQLIGIDGFAPGSDYRYVAAVAASLMAGWTLLLVWAARRPDVRRAVLGLTVVVLIGLMLASLSAVATHFVSLAIMAPTLAMQCVLAVFMAASAIQLPGPELAFRSDSPR